MSEDLIAEIREYSQQLAEEMTPVDFERGIAVMAVQRVPHPQLPPTRPRWVFSLAITVIVLLFGLVASLLRSSQAPPVATNVATPTSASPTTTIVGEEYLGVFSPIKGWIVYKSRSELMAVDPANPEDQLSLGPANELEPVGWSADGTRLLLVQSDSNAPYAIDLYVMKADGSVQQLTTGFTSDGGSLSPDGTAFVYAAEDGHLYAADGPDAAPQLLAATDFVTWLGDPAWSPDGSQIAFVGYNEGARLWSISAVNADGTGRRVIKEPDELLVYDLAWSPDGSQLAFIGQDTSQIPRPADVAGVFVVNADGSELKELTYGGGYRLVAWSPDGSRLAYLRSSLLFTMAADGSDQQRVEGVVVGAAGTIAWNPLR